MKILFTGGASGGHFYPVIAITEALRERAQEKKIILPKLYFMSSTRYNPRALFDNDLEFVYVPAGKIRRYFSLLNITDAFKTVWGMIVALIKMYRIYPDVVFCKGGYTSFPPVFAAKLLRIPVVVHESDVKPGRVNAWAGKFARYIAVSYPDAADYFDKSKVAFTGLPIRKEIITPLSNGAREFLNLEEGTPVVVILGGSQGAQRVNDVIMDSLPELVSKYQVIHQTGKKNFDSVKQTMSVVLKDNEFAYRYHPYDYLNTLAMRMASGIGNVIISRAGSTIFEIASWGLPSIILPLPKEVSHDQIENAFAYARSGACVVIEDENLTSHILVSEIDRIIKNQSITNKMKASAKEFGLTDAAMKIAEILLETGLEHE